MAIEYRLWETVFMVKKQPHLEITKSIDGIPMKGKCSACVDTQFQPTVDERTAEQHETLLRAMFDNHFKRIHLKEDTSQAAARIAREATKD
jgi:hypothetical protein